MNKILAYSLLAYKRRHRTIIKDLYQFFLHLPKFNKEIDYLQKLKNNHNVDKIKSIILTSLSMDKVQLLIITFMN